MNLKDKAFLEKFSVKESSIRNFGATEFLIMGWLVWYSAHQSKNDQISFQGISTRIGRFADLTPLDAWPSLAIQSRYQDPGELQAKIVRKHSD